MNLEEEIRDALHQEAGGSPEPPSWGVIRRRADARRRRRRAVGYPLAGVASAAAVVGLVVGVIALRDGRDEGGTVTAGPTGTPPQEIAAIVNGKVVVLSSEDGAIVRTLAEGGETEGASTVEVTPDGNTVYFTRADPDALCDQEPARQVVSVPIEGGPITIVASGQSPELSPDGRWLAYASGGPNQCGPANLLVIQELGTSAFGQQLYEGGGDVIVTGPRDWTADSKTLLYDVIPREGGTTQTKQVEPGSGGAPAPVTLPEDSFFGTYLAHRDALAVVQGLRRVVEANPATGEIRRTLFEAPSDIGSITADPSGGHVLFDTFEMDERRVTYRIWRWSEGEAPVAILKTAAPVQDFAWVPAARPPQPPTPDPEPRPESSAASPETIVAATVAGRLVELSSADGRVLRPLGSLAPIGHLELAPDGKVYYAQDPGNCPGSIYSGELGRLHRDREPLFFEFLAEHGRWPAVSPDGRRLAYVTVADCEQPASLAIRDLATGDERLLRVPPVDADGRPLELVGPLAWDADSRHLIVPVRSDAGTQHQYLDVDNATNVFEGGNIPRLGERGGPYAFASLGEPGRFAVMVADPDDEAALRVVEMNVPDGEVRRVLFAGVPRIVIPTLWSDASGHHLLFVTREGALYRWSDGDEEPTKVADGIGAADW